MPQQQADAETRLAHAIHSATERWNSAVREAAFEGLDVYVEVREGATNIRRQYPILRVTIHREL